MRIAELKEGDKKVNVEGIITSVNNPRTISNGSQVANATLEDESGQIKLSLWNEDIEKAPKGARVSIDNGFVSSYNSQPQLNVGKYGKLTFIGLAGEKKPTPNQTFPGAPFTPEQEARIRQIVAEELIQ